MPRFHLACRVSAICAVHACIYAVPGADQVSSALHACLQHTVCSAACCLSTSVMTVLLCLFCASSIVCGADTAEISDEAGTAAAAAAQLFSQGPYRRTYVQKVLAIVCAQLLFTALVATFFYLYEPIKVTSRRPQSATAASQAADGASGLMFPVEGGALILLHAACIEASSLCFAYCFIA